MKLQSGIKEQKTELQINETASKTGGDIHQRKEEINRRQFSTQFYKKPSKSKIISKQNKKVHENLIVYQENALLFTLPNISQNA